MSAVYLYACVCVCVYSVKEMQVNENNRTRMRCQVPFELPKKVEFAWRFAAEVMAMHTLLCFSKRQINILQTKLTVVQPDLCNSNGKMLNELQSWLGQQK